MPVLPFSHLVLMSRFFASQHGKGKYTMSYIDSSGNRNDSGGMLPAILSVVLAAAISLPALAAESEPQLIIANGAESLLWHTVPFGTTTLYWDKPETATSATLTIEGYLYSRTYENLTGEECEIALPSSSGQVREDVYVFTLAFDDGSSQTAYIGDVSGVGSSPVNVGRVRLDSSAKWGRFTDSAVIPVPYGATSLTVNGTEVEGIDGSAGWRRIGFGGLGGSSRYYELAMLVDGYEDTFLAYLERLSSATFLTVR